MNGSKGAQQSGSTTSTQAPPSYMYPYIGTALGQAGNLLQTGGQQYYPGQQIASFNPVQQNAMSGINNLGMNGTQQLNQTGRLDSNLMEGSGNPYENAMFNQAAQGVGNSLQSQFAGSGRDIAGSIPLAQQQENNLATQFYGQNYQNDVQNAMNAGNQAMNLYNTRLGGMNQALGIGNQVQNQAQNQIGANMNAWNFNQNQPFNNLQQYERFLSGVQPGQQQTNPYFTNPSANMLGTALAGQQLYNGYKGKGGSGGSESSNFQGIPYQ